MVRFKRSRTSSKYIYYALQLYFSGLSLRKTSERLSTTFIRRKTMFLFGTGFNDINQRGYFKRNPKYPNSVIDETLIKAGNEYVWLWIAVEPTDKIILGIRISIERTILVAEQFIQSLVRRYGKQKISTDGGLLGILKHVNS